MQLLRVLPSAPPPWDAAELPRSVQLPSVLENAPPPTSAELPASMQLVSAQPYAPPPVQYYAPAPQDYRQTRYSPPPQNYAPPAPEYGQTRYAPPVSSTRTGYQGGGYQDYRSNGPRPQDDPRYGNIE